MVCEVSIEAGSSVSVHRVDPMSSEGPVWRETSGSSWACGSQSSELFGLSRAPLTERKEVQFSCLSVTLHSWAYVTSWRPSDAAA
jgi:hypothetical protein